MNQVFKHVHLLDMHSLYEYMFLNKYYITSYGFRIKIRNFNGKIAINLKNQ